MVEWGEKDGPPKPTRPGRTPKKINCLRCAYYKVTWDPSKPRGCEVFGFKGRELPSVIVFNVTGKDCPSFELRKARSPEESDEKEGE